MSFTEVLVKRTDGTELLREFVRDTQYRMFLRNIYRTYKVVEEIASAMQIIIVA
jgi:hypothetical protein